MDFPARTRPEDAPHELLELTRRLLTLLLDGDHPTLSVLRAQSAVSRVKEIVLTGVGCLVDFDVPTNTPTTDPENFTGGNAQITLEGLTHGAGCVLFVRDGRLATLETFTYDETWPNVPKVLSITDVLPIHPSPAA